MSNKKKTADAVEILRQRYIQDVPERLASVEEERIHAKVARQIHELRARARLSQAQVAEKIDTTQSVISRLESADYEGHSLSMLRRIAEALDAKVDVELTGDDRSIRPYVFRTFIQYLRRSKDSPWKSWQQRPTFPEKSW